MIPDPRRAWLRRAALLCAALVLAVVALSAYIRLAQAGLGCADWPACYGQRLRDAQAGRAEPAPPAAVVTARAAHRVTAVSALGVVIALLVLASRRPRLAREGALALGLLALALGLTVLGLWSMGARVPAVAIGNVLGGVGMLALAWRLAVPPAPRPLALRVWAGLGVVLLLAQIALGTLVSASYAGLACPTTVDCVRDAAAAGWPWSGLDPWREPRFDAAAGPAGAAVQTLHHAGVLVVAAVLLPLAWAAWRAGARGSAAALVLLLALQFGLGLLTAAAGLPAVPALAHNVAAALLLAGAVRLV
jgi:cytochrome c oxidase assembly protein subunit 15